MLSDEAKQVASNARQQFEQSLRATVEKTDRGRYLCIEPESGDFFLGDTFDDAVNQAIDRHPHRLTHTLRIGYDAALHLGAALQ